MVCYNRVEVFFFPLTFTTCILTWPKNKDSFILWLMSVAYHKTLACLTLPRLHPYLKYSNPRREPRNKINRGFVGIVLLHLNSARSGDTQCRQSYSSPAKREKGGGARVWLCTRFVVINVMWLWQTAPTNSSRPWSSCLCPGPHQIHLITACRTGEMEQAVGAGHLVVELRRSRWFPSVSVAHPFWWILHYCLHIT